MIKLNHPNKENPYEVERVLEMLPAELSDIRVGNTVYLNNSEDINKKILMEHVIRDRILVARNSYGKAYGQDETLEEFRDYNNYLKARVRKRMVLIIRQK